MSLNIKNNDAVRLARRLSRLTGENMTQSILKSLEERLERFSRGKAKKSADMFSRVMALSRHCARLPDRDTRSPEEIIGFDDRGVF